jgi:hypothetical protein
MSYHIKTGKPKNKEDSINLDRFTHLQIPGSIKVGLVNRAERYKDWLDLSLEAEGTGSLAERLHSLAYIHRLVKEKGTLHLYAAGPLASIQVNCVRDFLIEHRSFLESMLPYIFSDVVHVTDSDSKKSSTN